MNERKLFSFLQYLLFPFSILYGCIIWVRNKLYQAGFLSSVSFDLPIICVGNLSVGGTGKTPHVEYLIRLLQYHFATATMSRGYKRQTRGFLLADQNANALKIGDEPMQYLMKYPDIAVSVAEERMIGIPELLSLKPQIEVLLLDDAFQHRSVKAGLNLLISDFSNPFYEDFILPLGKLREGRDAYKRASIIIVSKCPPTLSENAAQIIINKIKPMPYQKVYFTCITYGTPYQLFSKERLDFIPNNILGVCCIAQPAQFQSQLERIANEVHLLPFADHHYFLSQDLEEIQTTFNNIANPNKIIVTTEKDATRLWLQKERLASLNFPIYVLPMEVAFLFNAHTDFDQNILKYISEAAPYKEENEHNLELIN